MFTVKSSSLKMREIFPIVVITVLISLAQAKQKNVLFLVADDMRPNLGAYEDANLDIFGQPPMYTPNLDALAGK